jgi:hypothetical protein
VNCFCFCAGRPEINRNLPNLYKIHGDISDSRHLCFTEDQYYRWEQDDQYLVSKLRVLFSENVTLCLGYSFRDPNVQHQHFRAFLRFQGAVEPVYLLFDPARHPIDEWGFLKEQREYFGSRNVTLLFGSIPDLLTLIDTKAAEYSKSAAFQLEYLSPVIEDIKKWKSQLDKTSIGQHTQRLPSRPSAERLRMLTVGLIGFGLSPEIRETVGLSVGEGLPHDVGLFLLEDLKYLLVNHNEKELISETDFTNIIQLLNRFTTKDGGAWQFVQERKRFSLLFDFIPLLPDNLQPNLAPTFSEHLLFAGPSIGECWGTWNDLNRRISELPLAFLQRTIEEIIPADSPQKRKEKIQSYLAEDKAYTNLGVRLRLLQKHPGFQEVTGL